MAIRRDALEMVVRFVTEGQSRLGEAADALKKLAGSSDATAIDQVSRSIGELERSATGGTSGVEKLLSVMGGIGVAAAVTVPALAGAASQITRLVAEMGKSAEDSVNLADKLGLSVGRVEQLQAQADIAGVSINALSGAARVLSTALEDPSGAGKRAASVLRELGIASYEATGGQRQLGQLIEDVLQRLSNIDSDSARVLASQRLLGREAATALQPWIKNLKDLDEQVRSLGVGLNEELTKDLAKTDDAFDKLGVSFNELKKILAEPFSSPLRDILESIAAHLPGSRSGGQISNDAPFDPTQVTSPFRVVREADAVEKNYRATLAGTDQGRRSRIEELRRDIAKEEALIMGVGADADTKRAASSRALGMQSEIARIEAAIKEAQQRRSLIEQLPEMERQSRLASLKGLERINAEQLQLLERLGPGFEAQLEAIFGRKREAEIEKELDGGAKRLQALGAQAAALGREARKQVDDDSKDLLQHLRRSIAADKQEMERLSKQLDPFFDLERAEAQQRASSSIRRVGILARPGDERTAIQQVFEIRRALAKEIRDISLQQAAAEGDAQKSKIEQLRAEAQYKREIGEAELDREEQIIRLRRKSIEDYREAAGRVFDSLTASGSGGIRQFAQGLLRQQERAVFQNVSAGLLSRVGGTLGQIGAASGAGEFLRGTLFDPANAQQPVDRNTAAIEKQIKATETLTAVMSSGGTGAAGPGAIAGLFGSDTNGLTGSGSRGGFLARIFGGGSGAAGGGGFLAGLGSIFNGGGLFGLGSGSIRTGEGQATTLAGLGKGGRLGNTIGSIGLLAGGGLAIASGIREGGASGVLGAVSGGLSIASAIPGPQQPFLQAAAMVAGFVKTLLPDKRAQFDAEQNAILAQRRYTAPDAIANNFDFATGSDQTDFDWRGRVRVIVNRVVNVNVSALDARSVLERGDDIAEAVRQQVEAGHPLGLTMTNTVLGTT